MRCNAAFTGSSLRPRSSTCSTTASTHSRLDAALPICRTATRCSTWTGTRSTCLWIDASRISGILDWDNARRGHPSLDLARTHSLLTIEPSIASLPTEIRVHLDELVEAWSDGYGPEARRDSRFLSRVGGSGHARRPGASLCSVTGSARWAAPLDRRMAGRAPSRADGSRGSRPRWPAACP